VGLKLISRKMRFEIQVSWHSLIVHYIGAMSIGFGITADQATILITGGPGQTPSAALTQPSVTHVRVPQIALDDPASLALRSHQPIPTDLVSQIAAIAREIQAHYRDIPQKIEWSYDGTTLWLLEVRPI